MKLPESEVSWCRPVETGAVEIEGFGEMELNGRDCGGRLKGTRPGSIPWLSAVAGRARGGV